MIQGTAGLVAGKLAAEQIDQEGVGKWYDKDRDNRSRAGGMVISGL